MLARPSSNDLERSSHAQHSLRQVHPVRRERATVGPKCCTRVDRWEQLRAGLELGCGAAQQA